MVVKKQEVKDKPNFKYLRDKDREMVKGIFRFHEVPGGSMSFCFKAYREDAVERFDMVDGEIYTVPLGVARHLNKNLKYPIHGHIMDENRNPTMKISQWVRRCSFQSLEFIDNEDLTPMGDSLVQVELSMNSRSTGA
jgi:hypothetical protein